MHPAVLMQISHRHAEARILTGLVAAGFDDATLAQARVMAHLADNGSRLTELAARAQVTKQTAGFLVDQLVRAGYVERVPDPTDGRARLVRLAARGEEARTIARALEKQIEQEWTRHLGRERMRQLVALLEDLREVTDPWR